MNTKQFEDAVLKGLSLEKKKLPSWLIFDSKGSEIFNKITKLENYHPAKCEMEIFNTHKSTFSKIFSSTPSHLVELGSGDGEKTTILIKQLLEDGVNVQYTPIDISEGAINNLTQTLTTNFGGSSLKITGRVADYFEGLASISDNDNARKMVLFLGVTLNNMDIPDAKLFLKKLHQSLRHDDLLLIGFDLMKNPKLLHQSYNDKLFEEFNLHLLDRINECLGAEFDKKFFIQQGHYNPHSKAVESYLYSTCNQTVHIEALNKSFNFSEWEAMQTEQSLKYSIQDIEKLAGKSGFNIVESFYDSKKYFVDSLWQAVK
ncbi:MAG: L-histidine N(alpha)-methyltransferase [Nitrospinae bacterium]|nr:L-histidine N(alpha)-methyltransferase [Nitrospinota bacterium]